MKWPDSGILQAKGKRDQKTLAFTTLVGDLIVQRVARNDVFLFHSYSQTTWKVAIAGWTAGKPSYSFNCYVASGSTHNCSGNHQAMVEKYTNTSTGGTEYLYLDNWENYKGQFFTQSSSS